MTVRAFILLNGCLQLTNSDTRHCQVQVSEFKLRDNILSFETASGATNFTSAGDTRGPSASHILSEEFQSTKEEKDFNFKLFPYSLAAKHHNRHSVAKLTRATFPQGGFLLVHVNPHHINSINEEPSSDEMTNEILAHDLIGPEVFTASEQQHHKKLKRQSSTQGPINACCHSPANCRRVHCT